MAIRYLDARAGTSDMIALIGAIAFRYDTSDDQVKFLDDNGSTVRTIVTTDQTQTLTNKTFSSPSLTSPVITAGTITTSLTPTTTDGAALGSATLMFSDLFLASGGVINWNNGDVTITHASNKITVAGGVLAPGEGLDFNGLAPASHPISFVGMTLADNTNCIRGASVNPTRASGWTSFSGTVGATPAQVYTDYRELHTTGVAEVLGAGFFPYMDAGATCASMFATQHIAFVSTGSTVLTAAGAPGTGIFAGWFKTTLDNCTFNSGGQAAAIFAAFQANVVSVVGELTSMAYLEVASGSVKDVFYLKATGGAYATNLFTLTTETAPIVTWEPTLDPKNDSPTKGIRFVVGSTVYNIPAYVLP